MYYNNLAINKLNMDLYFMVQDAGAYVISTGSSQSKRALQKYLQVTF